MSSEKVFDWSGFAAGKGGDAGAEPLGADASVSPEAQGSVAAAQSSAAADAARSAAAASPRKRGRPRGDGSVRGSDSRALQAQVNEAIAQQLDALHDPEAWGALCAMPGDAIVAITGREHWQITKEERKTLGVTGSAFARTLMITNPRALAAMMFASAIFSAYGMRAMREMRDAAERKKQESEKKPDAAKT